NGPDEATKAHLDSVRGKEPVPLAPGKYEVYIGVDLAEETGPNSINYLGGRHDLRGRATFVVGADRVAPKLIEVALEARDDQGPDGRPPRRVYPAATTGASLSGTIELPPG